MTRDSRLESRWRSRWINDDAAGGDDADDGDVGDDIDDVDDNDAAELLESKSSILKEKRQHIPVTSTRIKTI